MWLSAIRDGAIVLLAVESVVIGVLLALTLMQIRRLIVLLRDEIKPMLEQAQDTMNNVQGTTRFVSHSVVDPLIKVSSVSSGVIEGVRSLFFIGRTLRRRNSPGVVQQASEGQDTQTQSKGGIQ